MNTQDRIVWISHDRPKLATLSDCLQKVAENRPARYTQIDSIEHLEVNHG